MVSVLQTIMSLKQRLLRSLGSIVYDGSTPPGLKGLGWFLSPGAGARGVNKISGLRLEKQGVVSVYGLGREEESAGLPGFGDCCEG